MKRKTKLVALLCIMLLAVCLCATGAAAFADSSDDEVIVYKSLVSTGAASAGEVQWSESGNPDGWPGCVEEIRDASQPDGGDVILRTELDNAGTALVSGEVGFARESTSFDKAAYPMNGFTMKFYHQGTSNVMFIFTKNSGWYGGSDTYWSIWFQGKNAALRVMNGSGDFVAKANATVKTFYSDYEYLSDPDTQGYKAVGDNTKTFVGTQNVFEIKPDGGNLCAFLNGQKLFDLTQQGVVADVFDKSDARGMFLSYWKPGSAVFAMKITDIYNVKSSWEDGVPATYETTDAASVEHKVSEAGTVQFRGKESANYDFDITYKTAQYFADLTATFTYDGTQLNNGDTLSLVLTDSGAADDKLELEFAKKSNTTASLTVKKDGTAVGDSQDVSFSYNGTAINTVSVKETVPFVLTVNGNTVEIEQSAFTAMKSAIDGGKVKVGYAVVGSELSMLTPVAYNSAAVETFDKVDGLNISGDVTIKSDGNYRMIYNSGNGGYTAAYTANKIIADSFTVSYKFGKYGANEQPLRVKVGESDNAVIFEIAPIAGKNNEASLNVYAVSGATENKIQTETIDFDWTYECGVRSLGFVNDGGTAYLVFIDGDVATSISGNGMTAISAVVNSLEGKMADVSFTVADEALTAFAFCDYDYYVGKANAGGWGEGAIPKMQFGYDALDNAVLIFDNAYSYQKNKEVPVDGFTMTFKSYAKTGSATPTWAIASSTAWYSNTSAVMFGVSKKSDTTATFSIMYTNKTDGEFEYITNNAENKHIVSYTVDWNWNNGIDNTISLNLTDGVWRWTVNGEVLAPESESDEDYSDYIAEVYSTFTSENSGVVQIFGGANMVWNISSMSEIVINVDPTVKNPTLKTSYAVGEEITLNLDTVFSDANGDTLTYVVNDGTPYGEITDGVWKFTPDAEGLYTVIIEAYDGNGGEATLTLTVNVEKEQGGSTGGDNGKKTGCGSAAGAGAFASLAAVLLAAAAILLKRKATVK